ncbi:(S)-beta-bisabolene synthase-like isoform X1 [Musa acuminata AAA Group]|uniref:(S)-beta-bisabolene synthase-like isoform X1 n=2 Tax=Musa acuminata AAA Group TaxID=214697 RepID=UPI0031DC2656
MEAVSPQSPDAPGHQVVRQCAVYHPDLWGDYFITHHPCSDETESEAWMRDRDEELREEVRRLFQDNNDVKQTMHLIDTIQLLGLDYHFEEELTEALKRVYDADSANDGLYEVSLRFRLLREKGYSVTSDVFDKFKDEGGSFSRASTDDVKGLLSLYNAAYLGTHGETILDEAISFTRSHLTSMVHDLNPPMATLVSLALETPLRRSIKRLFARHYISIYQEEPTRNDKILELAKLDFHILQSLHRRELKDVCMWWKDLALTKTLSFARDRAVEAYYWILGVYYEPQFSRARVMTTKIVLITSILDDIYDDYSTLEESQLLTDAIQRWDFEAVDQLPEYLKDFFLKLLIIVQEFETELAAEEKFRIFYLKEALKSQARAYFVESRWRDEKYVPTLEEHLGVSKMSSACPLLASASLVGMGEVATKEAFEWVASFPKIVEALAAIGRIMNDITSYEREGKREHVVSTVHCCMKEYGTSIDDACKKLQEMVEDAWKDINQECLNPTTFLAPLLQTSLYFTRILENVYKYIDAYTESNTTMRECISLLLVQPVPI